MLLASVMFTGPAIADETMDALKAREAALMMELQQVRRQLNGNGVATSFEVAAAPKNETMRQDDGHSLLYSGTVELGAGGAFADCTEDGDPCEDEDFDADAYPYLVGAGRASIPIGDNVSVQIDAEGWATFTDRGGVDNDDGQGEDNLQTSFSGAVHGTWRDPSSGAAGVFAQAGSSNGGEDENATFWLVGAEAQAYLGDVTLYGQGGYFEADDETEDDVITDAFFLRGVGRWFLNPRTRLQGEFSWVTGDENIGPGDDPGSDYNGYSWGVRVDRILTGHPISLFAAYDGLYMALDAAPGSSDDDGDLMEHRFLVGATFHFNVDDLIAQDRRGVTLDTPDVGRWTAVTMENVDG
jgi:hypothetical protein